MKEILDSHYKKIKYEPIRFIERFNFNFLLGNVIKYISRHSHKNKQKDIQRIQEFYLPHIVRMPFISFWDPKFAIGEITDELSIYMESNEFSTEEKDFMNNLFLYLHSPNVNQAKNLNDIINYILNNYHKLFEEE